MEYQEIVQAKAQAAFDVLYAGVDRLAFSDFPDYPNIGDSAIAVGQLRYFKDRKIDVANAHCIGTVTNEIFDSKIPVMINGGGNIAGLYPAIDEHRNSIATRLKPDVLLIQAPQSVYFASAAARSAFVEAFAPRKKFRIAVRDRHSADALVDDFPDVQLAPDAVHLLGRIAAPPPSRDIAVLIRNDDESASAATGANLQLSEDWPPDPRRELIGSWVRWKGQYLGPAAQQLNLSVSRWASKAQSRVSRGVTALSVGEVVVTDRLHAMLIALQMGREVVAVDNSTGKLSKYADTWFSDISVKLTMAASLDEAMRIARTRSL